jgi:phage tail-like protein
LRALTITDDHYLVAGVLDPAGLLIFDLHAGGGPLQMVWPAEVEFTPFDFAARTSGGIVILDRDPDNPSKAPRYWVLDRHFNVEAPDGASADLDSPANELFHPVFGDPPEHRPRMFPQGITLQAASPISAIDAIAIESLPDQSVLILDRDEASRFSKVLRYDAKGRAAGEASTEIMKVLIEDDRREEFKLVAHDFAFVAEHQSDGVIVTDRLYVVEEKGNQAFAFNISSHDADGSVEPDLKLDPLPDYLPMRLFEGKGLVTGDELAYYDFAERWIPLTEQLRPRFEIDAALESPFFDGAEPDCRWHRLMIEGCIPPEARVEVWTRGSNEARDLQFTEWREEPAPYRRSDGSELPFVTVPRTAQIKPRFEYETWELLIQRTRGRFLQVKLRLSGNGRTSPRLRALRVYYPRFSYLEHYLPGVYREDAQSASFLDRFLANTEGFYTAIEDKIAAVQTLFDVRSVPAEYLDWLAGWLGVVLDPAWSERKRRLFISHAMDFFQLRGTIHGLKTALRLAMEECADESLFDVQRALDPRRDTIRIIEGYRSRRTPAVVLGDPTSPEGALPPVGLPQATPTGRWQSANGRSDLYARYSTFLSDRFGATLPEIVRFPLQNYDWQKLSPQPSGPVTLAPVIDSNDAALWRGFLMQRYSTIEILNLAHGTNLNGFSSVTIPATFLAASTPLDDWNSFIASKSGGWTEFSEQSLGFVPRGLGNELSRWRSFLASRYPSIGELKTAYGENYAGFDEVPLPDTSPPAGKPREDWDDYQQQTAGTTASVNRRRWQEYLARRYRRIAALNLAWNSSWIGFGDVAMPGELPAGERALADWYRFESVVLAITAAAHRFTVLLPAPAKRDAIEFQQRRELATRIANWEKPAHTVFDVKFYWAMFRVGGARLGFDTLLDVGSRAPDLLSPMVLGQGYLAEGYLTDGRDLAGRQIAGSCLLPARRRFDAVT